MTAIVARQNLMDNIKSIYFFSLKNAVSLKYTLFGHKINK